MTCISIWLSASERITFWFALLVYRSQHRLAPPYLADIKLQRLADIESQRLRSASTTALVGPWYYPLDNWWPRLSCSHCSSVSQPSTAGDVITVAKNLSVAFKDITVYSVIWLRLTMIYLGVFCIFCFVLYCHCLCLNLKAVSRFPTQPKMLLLHPLLVTCVTQVVLLISFAVVIDHGVRFQWLCFMSSVTPPALRAYSMVSIIGYRRPARESWGQVDIVERHCRPTLPPPSVRRIPRPLYLS